MILGKTILGYKDNILKTTNYVNNFYRIEIQDGLFNEIKIDESVSIVYNSAKEEWGYDTIFDFKASQGNLEAGNVDNKDIPIQKILFQKRRIGELEWTNLATIDFQEIQKIYEWTDKYIENDCPYEYCVTPLTATVIGKRSIVEITPKFEGIYLTDKDTNVQLLLNMERGDIENVNPSANFEPLNGQFPITRYSTLNYKKEPIKALVASSKIFEEEELSVHQEKIYREKILNFLKNHKPKLFRDQNGDFLMINIINNPKFSANNDVKGTIGNINFDMVEIGNTDEESLKKFGFI